MIHKGVKHKVEPGQNSEKICAEKDTKEEQIDALCVRCNLKFPNKTAFDKHKRLMHRATLVF